MAPNIVDILGCLEPQDISYYDISYYDICLNPYITLEIINKYTEDILWDVLSCNNSLSPLIIDKFKDKLNWNFVCRYNKYINENFIEKHDERIVFSELSRNHWLSRELVNKYNHRVSILDWLRIQIFG